MILSYMSYGELYDILNLLVELWNIYFRHFALGL